MALLRQCLEQVRALQDDGLGAKRGSSYLRLSGCYLEDETAAVVVLADLAHGTRPTEPWLATYQDASTRPSEEG